MRRILRALLLLLISPAIASAAPSITDISPADGSWTNNKTIGATVTGGAGLTVTIADVPASNGGSGDRYTADVTLSASSNPNPITIVATDVTGSTSVMISVNFDETPPEVAIDAPADNLETDFRSVIVSGKVTELNDLNAFQVAGVLKALPPLPDRLYNERVDLAPGVNNITVAARDLAGNVGRKTIHVTWLKVCRNPTFPSDPAVPQPTPITVDRTDDLADPVPDDDICDVRPDLRPQPADPNDPNTPPPFVPPFGHCTLRAAIQTANHHPGPDRIRLSRPVTLTRVGAGEDAAATGDLDVTDELQILGGGRDSASIDGTKLGDRVFDVHDGVKLQLVNVTVIGGHTPRPAAPLADPNDAERGGCLRSRGSLQVNNAAFLNCKADGSGGAISVEPSLADPNASATLTCTIVARSQAKLDGGGVAFDGVPLTVRNSTLSLNSAGRRGGALSGIGGADPNDLVLKNVTLSQNKAKVAGGALDLGDDAHASLNNCTFAKNSARVGASLSTTGSGDLEISNSILGDTAKLACDPNSPEPVVSLGGNIDRGDSCNLGPTELTNTDPKLDKLATNLGPPTHALKVGSPAIDYAGTGAPCEALDARDVERGDWPLAGGGAGASPPFCDAGAFELRTPTPTSP